jgi:hypothetical protein
LQTDSSGGDGKFFLGKQGKDFTGPEGGSVILWAVVPDYGSDN